MEWMLHYTDAKYEGREEAKLEAAVIAVTEFGISPELVAEKYSLPLTELTEALSNISPAASKKN